LYRKVPLTVETYCRDQSLRFRMEDSVCFAQNSADWAPNLMRQDENSEQLLISQNEGWSTRSIVPEPSGLTLESQSFLP